MSSQRLASFLLKKLSPPPAFRVFGKADYESEWHLVDVYVTARRDADSRWPLWRNHAMTLTADAIALGRQFAEQIFREQRERPASRDEPVRVLGGRLKIATPRLAAGGSECYSCSELLAHECGHTAQARRMGFLYWPLVGSVTLFGEGPHWWQRMENQASETGLFGGLA